MQVSTIIFGFRFCHKQYMLWEWKKMKKKKTNTVLNIKMWKNWDSKFFQNGADPTGRPQTSFIASFTAPPFHLCARVSPLFSPLICSPVYFYPISSHRSSRFSPSWFTRHARRARLAVNACCAWIPSEGFCNSGTSVGGASGTRYAPVKLFTDFWKGSALKALVIKVCPATVTAHQANIWNVMLTPNYATLSERRGPIARLYWLKYNAY